MLLWDLHVVSHSFKTSISVMTSTKAKSRTTSCRILQTSKTKERKITSKTSEVFKKVPNYKENGKPGKEMKMKPKVPFINEK